MKFAAVLAVAAVGVSAHANNVTYTTEVVTAYTTYCPAATEIVHGGKTYTVTEATTLTITDCPCTITKPVITSSAVVCHDCPAPPPVHAGNSTLVPVVPTGKPSESVKYEQPAATPNAPESEQPAATPTTAESVPTAGAGKVAALSGAGLAGLVGLAAFL